MMIRHRRPAAALAALGLAATFSVATTHAPEGCYVALEGDPAIEDDDVFACEEQHWFHRATTPASNVGYVAEQHGIATFDTNPPAGSVTGGNGGGYAAWATLLVGADDDVVDAQFVGSYTGVIDRLDVDLHVLVDTLDTLGVADHPVDIGLQINGATVWSADQVRGITPVPEENSSAGANRLDFAITGLAERLDGFNFPNGPETVHDVRLTIGSTFLDEVNVYAFDTTEVPGGIGFNRVDIPAGTFELDAS